MRFGWLYVLLIVVGCGVPMKDDVVWMNVEPEYPKVEFSQLAEALGAPSATSGQPTSDKKGKWREHTSGSTTLRGLSIKPTHVKVTSGSISEALYEYSADGRRERRRGAYLDEKDGKDHISFAEETRDAICHRLTGYPADCITPSPIREPGITGELEITNIMTECSCTGNHDGRGYTLRSELNYGDFSAALVLKIWVSLDGVPVSRPHGRLRPTKSR